MDNAITISPSDLYAMAIAICTAIITVSGAMAIVSKIIERAKKPNTEQNERIAKLEGQVVAIEKRLHQGTQQFMSDARRMNELEESMKESNTIIIEALQSLIEHAVDGNNTDNMKEMRHKLDKYLRER